MRLLFYHDQMVSSLHSKAGTELGKWLKRARQEAGLTMDELAQNLGISLSVVGKIEQTERRLDVVEFIQYCEAVGADPKAGLRIAAKQL